MVLEKILESYPKNIAKIHRKVEIKLKDLNLIYGAKNIGKTNFVLQYYQQAEFKNLKKMYINLKDSKINPNKDFDDLESFCQKEKVEILIVDSYMPSFKLPNLPKITLISDIPYQIANYSIFELPPITFYEYQQIHKPNIQDSFNNYLKYGNLFEAESLNDYKKGEFLKFLANDNIHFWILKNLAQNLGLKVSLHQIYTKLKKEGKISKDRFYEYAKFLQDSKILFWLEKFEHNLSPKKLYFYDFTLKNAVSYDKNFSSLFENMVFLELLYHFKQDIFFTDKLDFYLPQVSLGILCLPFIQQHSLEQKLHKIIKEREYCEKFLIITLNQKGQGENLGTPYTLSPFYDFALQNSLS
ncbi:ATP-binding protein [Helicobacter pullorum]|uniref:ATP-binding protein n=1 Tax=Helicobacter pullorum TaxID=35818 RepID=UPI0008168786|nr:ATP-binding protein [Helicobacter pullorum]OCR15926.1 hypothetical protein BA916_04145 [Helicobacter pullorum]